MTLIVGTITRRGVVLAADRLTITSSKSSGQSFVIGDDSAQKILVCKNLLLAYFGYGQFNGQDAHVILQHLLQENYHDSPTETLTAIRHLLPPAPEGKSLGLAIAGYPDGRPRIAVWDSRFDQREVIGPRAIFLGTIHDPLAIYEQYPPMLKMYDLQTAVDYSVFMIELMHQLKRFTQNELNTVGLAVTVGVVDANGARLIEGYEPKPRPQLSL